MPEKSNSPVLTKDTFDALEHRYGISIDVTDVVQYQLCQVIVQLEGEVLPEGGGE